MTLPDITSHIHDPNQVLKIESQAYYTKILKRKISMIFITQTQPPHSGPDLSDINRLRATSFRCALVRSLL